MEALFNSLKWCVMAKLPLFMAAHCQNCWMKNEMLTYLITGSIKQTLCV